MQHHMHLHVVAPPRPEPIRSAKVVQLEARRQARLEARLPRHHRPAA